MNAETPRIPESLLVPVLPLRDVCLFPEASLSVMVGRPASIKALELAARTGRRVLGLAQKDANTPNPISLRDLQEFGTLADLAEDRALSDGNHRVELDGVRRARVLSLFGADTLVAEIELLEEGDPGDEWGAAVEALARYLHSHPELRSFLDQQRRSREAMSWVNLACQHLPIAATARQRLLESDAVARCLKISRGLDALLRKEKGD